MDCCAYDSRRFFLLGMRMYFGIWLLYVGLVKWFVFGASNFVGTIVTQFEPTWSPAPLNTALGWLIVVAEPALALWILSGVKPRAGWALTSLLMFLLAFGQTILMKDAMGNWFYVLITLVCAALSEPMECTSKRE